MRIKRRMINHISPIDKKPDELRSRHELYIETGIKAWDIGIMEISKAFISIGGSICEEVYGMKYGHTAFIWV